TRKKNHLCDRPCSFSALDFRLNRLDTTRLASSGKHFFLHAIHHNKPRTKDAITMVAADDVATLASSPPAGESASHPFTCNTCTIAYRNIDLQRGHMKSDWHRYNLKRRVASLPPITSETFNEKVLQARAVQTAEAATGP
ncbi:hypothetical protein BN1723_008466, partial [Verticillium longisporum]